MQGTGLNQHVETSCWLCTRIRPHITWIASSLGRIGSSKDKIVPAPGAGGDNSGSGRLRDMCSVQEPPTVFEAVGDGNQIIILVHLGLQEHPLAFYERGAVDGGLLSGRSGPLRLPDLSVTPCLSSSSETGKY